MRVADESFTAIETLYGIGYRYNDTWQDMTAGDRSHSATETAEAERETHQTEGIGARHWPKLVRAHQSKKLQNQNWIAKASGALSRRLHSSKVLIISVNMVLVIILLLFNAATLYKWRH